MTEAEYMRAFEARLPVYARITGITAGEVVIEYSCISAITNRWSQIQGRPIMVLELYDKNSNSITNALPKDCFLSKEEAEEKQQRTSSAAGGPLSPQGEDFGKKLSELIELYQRHTGTFATPAVKEGLENYLLKGMTAEVIKRVIEYAAEKNSRNWRYINTVLLGKLTKGVKTLEDYDRDEGLWEERRKQRRYSAAAITSHGDNKRNKFNNYTDTNKPDYSDFSQQIIADMLAEAKN